jgi:hypothetical protein
MMPVKTVSPANRPALVLPGGSSDSLAGASLPVLRQGGTLRCDGGSCRTGLGIVAEGRPRMGWRAVNLTVPIPLQDHSRLGVIAQTSTRLRGIDAGLVGSGVLDGPSRFGVIPERRPWLRGVQMGFALPVGFRDIAGLAVITEVRARQGEIDHLFCVHHAGQYGQDP